MSLSKKLLEDLKLDSQIEYNEDLDTFSVTSGKILLYSPESNAMGAGARVIKIHKSIDNVLSVKVQQLAQTTT